MTIITRDEYYNLGNLTNEGTPVQLYYDPQLDRATATIHLFPAPDATSAADRQITFFYQRPFEDFDTSTDTGGYVIVPYVDKIRAAVSSAFDVSPAVIERREALSEEGASVRVLNGSGKENQASRIAGYLEYNGISASAPNQKPDTRGQAATIIRVYNGAEERIPQTIAFLESGSTSSPSRSRTRR